MSNTLSWKNVDYQVGGGRQRYSVKWDPLRVVAKEANVRRILNNVSGVIKTGEMVAIIGASGAGKTSIMASLCNRIRGKIKGSFYVNHLPAKKNMISQVTGFVPQYETAVAVLTVIEHLRFVAELKLGRAMARWEKEERVQRVIERLGMINLKHSRIKHLSGGEKKKLNLAEELLREPLFLFCDEPTTGLDSFNGKSVMQSLKFLTGSDQDDESAKRAVICSIHQPSSEVFNFFSHIILMHNGSIVYHGQISDCYILLDEIGLSVPPNFNPAEFFVKLVSPILMNGIEHEQRIEQLCELNRKNLAIVDSLDKPKLSTTDIEEVEPLPWFSQIKVLLRRATMIGFRDMGETIMNSSSNLLIALGIGILYAGKAMNPQAFVSDFQGMVFNVIAQIYFYTYIHVISEFTPELPVVRKETGENLYFISAYYIMKFLSLLPKVIVECVLTSTFAYYLSSFTRDFDTYLAITTSFVMLGITAASYGLMWGSLCGSGLGHEISTPFDVYQMLVSGLYVNLATIPWYLKYFSLFYYFNEAVSYQYWIGVDKIDCVADRNLPCLQTGMEVLDAYSYGSTEQTVILNYACCLGWCLVFHTIGFYALKRGVLKEGFY